MNHEKYLEYKRSEALDHLRFLLNRLTIDRLKSIFDAEMNELLPSAPEICQNINDHDDDLVRTAATIYIAEKFFRLGCICNHPHLDSENIGNIFEDRTQAIMDDFKLWLREDDSDCYVV